MTRLRLATFNCENLFARYNFNKDYVPSPDGFTMENLGFVIHDSRDKRITGKAIFDIDADVVALQEVDNLPVLDRFHSEYLSRQKTRRYPHRLLVDGNDPRHIDVGLLSRHPVRSMRSFRHLKNAAGSADLFSRDCLCAEIEVGGTVLTVYVNHFKSMMEGRAATRARRAEQAEQVLAIVQADFGTDLDGPFAILGDLNDYPETDADGTETALGALLGHRRLVNVVERLPKKDRWTHYYKRERAYRQLDYILLSQALDEASGRPKPGRNLRGLPWRAEAWQGDRYEDVGEDAPKASDHVPLWVDVEVGA
jgi:endonuclease/exonuclease/phosphatase family metal-dependent hydrolase